MSLECIETLKRKKKVTPSSACFICNKTIQRPPIRVWDRKRQWRKLFSSLLLYFFVPIYRQKYTTSNSIPYGFPSEGIPLCVGTFPLATAHIEILLLNFASLGIFFSSPIRLFVHFVPYFHASVIRVRVHSAAYLLLFGNVYITTMVQLSWMENFRL